MLRLCFRCRQTHDIAERCSQETGRRRIQQAIRQRILTRDKHTCQECGAPASHVDHITPRAMGGGETAGNLQSLCGSCNLRKGNA